MANIQVKTLGTRKFLSKWISLLKINVKVGVVAYRLKLLGILKIYNVFHVSLFNP